MYWKRFCTDYLNKLREQHIYSSTKPGNPRLLKGDVVIIKDDDLLPRGKWKKGVITQLIQGKDGKIRGAVIKCFIKDKYVEYERPIQRLVPFELVPELNSNDSASIPTIDVDSASTSQQDCINLPNEIPIKERRLAAIAGERFRRSTNQI